MNLLKTCCKSCNGVGLIKNININCQNCDNYLCSNYYYPNIFKPYVECDKCSGYGEFIIEDKLNIKKKCDECVGYGMVKSKPLTCTLCDIAHKICTCNIILNPYNKCTCCDGSGTIFQPIN